MRVLISSKKIEVTEALRSAIEAQAQKLGKLHKQISWVQVFIEHVPKKSKDVFANKVTFEVSLPGKNVVVKNHAHDMYKAISGAAESAVRQVRKEYERRATLRRKQIA
ncbi:MAG: ribosome-associated translation inhibitor RaiA [Pseudomonadales bacterium]|nr:ribosome-associated translation inhibitor RaiA [Candidatus Woesebacteria bacterium]MCB9801979.1 ribosome-associated translation inhibitor RaiA [Pseudomonadales bacterium]